MSRGYYNSSAAYDFDLFLPKEKREAAPIIAMPRKPQTKAKSQELSRGANVALRRFKIALTAITVAGLAFAMIYLRVEITDTDRELRRMQAQTELLAAEENRLLMELENKMSIRNVEVAAVGMGMQRAERGQITYVNVGQTDTQITAENSPQSNGEQE